MQLYIVNTFLTAILYTYMSIHFRFTVAIV